MRKALTNTFLVLSVLSSVALAGCGQQSGSSQQTAEAAQTATVESTYFTKAGEHPEKAIQSVIHNAKSDLNIAIYSLTEDGIVKEMLDARQRGVNIRIITDDVESKNKYQNQNLHKLLAAGVPVKINTHPGLMHMKMTVADGLIFTVGSFNYTKAASTTNDEVLVILKDPAGAQKCVKEFERMWSDTKNFKDFQ